MDTLRYGVALVIAVAFPPALAYWILVHPLARFWQRLGVVASYGLLSGLLLALGMGLYRVCALLIGADLGTCWPGVVVAVLVYAGAVAIGLQWRKHLSATTLLGVPELAGAGEPEKILTQGIYARVRHPRYLSTGLVLVALALVANYAGTYALALLLLAILYGIVIVEERELVDRLGDAYREYRESVPRFIPSRKRRRPDPG